MMRTFTMVLTVAAAGVASAQGSIGTQGFGYPTGGLSARAAAAGGALAEFDFSSARNPSSALAWGRGGLYFQYEPEFRSVSNGSTSENTMTARFPVWMAGMQLGSRAIATLTSSTLLDRTWATRVRGGQILGPDSVGYEERVESSGAINDVRLAFAYSVRPSFSVGIGLHGYTGENRMNLVRQFDDSLRYGTLVRRLTIGYLGSAVSAGATWRPNSALAVAASLRSGGSLDVRIADTLVASGSVPARIGVGIRFDGFPGMTVALSAEQTRWSDLGEMTQSALSAHDAWEYGAGVEMTGPRYRGTPLLFYAGYRRRDLPFSVNDQIASEKFLSAGAGLPIAGPRALIDLAIQRATRGPIHGVSERAWIMSLGFTVRP